MTQKRVHPRKTASEAAAALRRKEQRKADHRTANQLWAERNKDLVAKYGLVPIFDTHKSNRGNGRPNRPSRLIRYSNRAELHERYRNN